MTKNFPSVYPYTFAEANRLNEINYWAESQVQNILCKEAIESAINSNFDGFTLSETGAGSVLESFGFKRVQHVLANTILEKDYDGRFDPSNKDWAKSQGVLADKGLTQQFVVQSHPAVLNGFVHQVRDAYAQLQMYGTEHCETIWQELRGKVLVMKPSTLKESYWSPENQLWYAEGGFGCSPTASGRAVYATCLGDGENHVRWNREDFLGVLKEDLLPDWAREQLDKLKSGQEIGPVDTGPTQVMNL